MKRKGFTLIELLVVIAILGILIGLLIPAILGALTDAKVMKMLNNGKNIYTTVFREVSQDRETWPKIEDHATSTDYFIYLLNPDDDADTEDAILNVSFDFFAGPGLVKANTSDEEEFTAANNAWSYVSGLALLKETVPFLISRNFTPTALSEASDKNFATGDGVLGEDVDGGVGLEFNDSQVLFIRKGGAGEKLDRRQCTWERLNPTKSTPALARP